MASVPAPGAAGGLLCPAMEDAWGLPKVFSQDLFGLSQPFAQQLGMWPEEDSSCGDDGAMLDASMLESAAAEILESGPMEAGSSGEVMLAGDAVELLSRADVEDVACAALMCNQSSHQLQMSTDDLGALTCSTGHCYSEADTTCSHLVPLSHPAFEEFGHVLSQPSLGPPLDALLMPSTDLLFSMPSLMPAAAPTVGCSQHQPPLSMMCSPAHVFAATPRSDAVVGGVVVGGWLQASTPSLLDSRCQNAQMPPLSNPTPCMVPAILQQLSPAAGDRPLSPIQLTADATNPTIIMPRRVSRPPPFKSKSKVLEEQHQQFGAAASSRSMQQATGDSSSCVTDWYTGASMHPELSSTYSRMGPSTGELLQRSKQKADQRAMRDGGVHALLLPGVGTVIISKYLYAKTS